MSYPRIDTPRKQSGFSYVEMLVATVIVLVSLGPAIDSLRSTQLAAEIHGSETDLHYRVLGRMEDVLAEPFDALIDGAAKAGSAANPSSYSDLVSEQDRVVVYLSHYDVADTDNDKDFFTRADSDIDFDSNPYTGTDVVIDVVWIRVAIAGTSHVLESLSHR